jgi:hypothetical protein
MRTNNAWRNRIDAAEEHILKLQHRNSWDHLKLEKVLGIAQLVCVIDSSVAFEQTTKNFNRRERRVLLQWCRNKHYTRQYDSKQYDQVGSLLKRGFYAIESIAMQCQPEPAPASVLVRVSRVSMEAAQDIPRSVMAMYQARTNNGEYARLAESWPTVRSGSSRVRSSGSTTLLKIDENLSNAIARTVNCRSRLRNCCVEFDESSEVQPKLRAISNRSASLPARQ